MRTTGIIRRIDELGRVVIPKEIRRTMRLKVGEEMEIFAEGENLVLRKFSIIGHLEEYAKIYAEAIAKTTNCTVLITDNDKIVAASGENKKEYQDKELKPVVAKLYAERTVRTLIADDTVCIVGEVSDARQQIFTPIISNGDIIGGIIILSKENDNNNAIYKLIDVASDFLGSLL